MCDHLKSISLSKSDCKSHDLIYNTKINVKENYEILLDHFKKENEIFQPSIPKIATITLITSINTSVNLYNCSKIMRELVSSDRIISIKYAKGNILINKSISNKKTLKPKPVKKNFYNQCTIIIKCKNGKAINLKLFLNGKIQMTGCKDINNAYEVLEILGSELKKEWYSVNEGKLKRLEVIDNYDFKHAELNIQLINEVYDVGFSINRDVLHKLFIEKYNIQSIYQPIIYVGVNSKINVSSGTLVSVLIFKTGKIIITAGKTENDIWDAYKFINTVLYDNYDQISLKFN